MSDERTTGGRTEDFTDTVSGTVADRDVHMLTTIPSIRFSDSFLCQLESASQVADALIAKRTVIKERFQLEALLGFGGMGSVYKATDRRKVEARDPNPWVAIKLLNEDFKKLPGSLKALQRESRKAQDLAHPNIVQVFDFDRDDEVVFMTMELLEGEDLSQLIQHNPQGLPLEKTLEIAREMIDALQHAHDNNIVHADFTPRNIFLTHAGKIKVLDFGIAQAMAIAGLAATEAKQTMFDSVTLRGMTPGYAGLERLQGMSPVPSDDVFALGCVIYTLLCGAHPYKGKTATDALECNIFPDRISTLSGRQWRSLHKAIALSRCDRYLSVADFAADFAPLPRPAVRSLIMAAGIVLFSVGALIYQSAANHSGDQQRVAEIEVQKQELSMWQRRMEEKRSHEERQAATELARLSSGYSALVETLLAEQRYDEALTYLDKLRNMNPQHVDLPQLQSRLVSSRENSERYRQAADDLKQRLAQLLLEAEQHIHAGALVRPGSDNAFGKYKEVLALDPDNVEARLLLQRLVQLLLDRVDASLHSGNLGESAVLLEHLVGVAPRNQNILRLRSALDDAISLQLKRKEDSDRILAQASGAQGKLSLPERRDLYLRALQIDPTNLVAEKGLSQTSSEIARFEEMRKAKAQEDAEALTLHARDLLNKNSSTPEDFRLAREYLEASILKSPDYGQAVVLMNELPQRYIRAAKSRMEERDYAEAEGFLHAAIVLSPRSEEVIQLQTRLKLLEADAPLVVPVSF